MIYSVIILKGAVDQTTSKEYGVYTYKEKDGKLVCYKIMTNKPINDEKYYTFRGGVNRESDYYSIKASEVLYRYTGYYNVLLRYLFVFLESPYYLAAIVSRMIVLNALVTCHFKKQKLYDIELPNYLLKLNNIEQKNLANKCTNKARMNHKNGVILYKKTLNMNFK